MSRSRILQAVVLVAAALPLLCALAIDIGSRDHYLFAAVAAPAAAILAWWAVRGMPSRQPGSRAITACAFALAVALFAAAAVFQSPRGAAVSLIVAAIAVSWDAGGWALTKALWPALALVALCVPLPFDADRAVLAAYETTVAAAGGRILDTFGVANVHELWRLETAAGWVDTRDLIGGFWSPFAAAALAVGVAGLLKRGPVRTVAMAAAAAIFLWGTMAVAAAFVATRSSGVGAAAALAFACAAALTLSADQLFGIPLALRAPVASDPSDEIAAPQPVAAASERWAWATAGAFVCIGIASLASRSGARAAAPEVDPAPDGRLPTAVGPWQTTGSDPAVRTYRDGHRTLVAGLASARSLPIAALEAEGWVVRQWQPAEDAAGTAGRISFARVGLVRPREGVATVWVTGPTVSGQWVPLPARPTPRERLVARLGTSGHAARPDEPAWWLWVRLDSHLPPTAADVKLADRFVADLAYAIGANGGRPGGVP